MFVGAVLGVTSQFGKSPDRCLGPVLDRDRGKST
jgi:hypothetical protein